MANARTKKGATSIGKRALENPSMKTGIRKIDTLKLDDIVSVVRKERGWSARTAQDAEIWYRLFLAMSKKKGGKPAFGIEENSDYIWHEHITSTKRYRKDCKEIFGKFLDHTPGRPKNWKAKLARSMKEYDKTFGFHPKNASTCCT